MVSISISTINHLSLDSGHWEHGKKECVRENGIEKKTKLHFQFSGENFQRLQWIRGKVAAHQLVVSSIHSNESTAVDNTEPSEQITHCIELFALLLLLSLWPFGVCEVC